MIAYNDILQTSRGSTLPPHASTAAHNCRKGACIVQSEHTQTQETMRSGHKDYQCITATGGLQRIPYYARTGLGSGAACCEWRTRGHAAVAQGLSLGAVAVVEDDGHGGAPALKLGHPVGQRGQRPYDHVRPWNALGPQVRQKPNRLHLPPPPASLSVTGKSSLFAAMHSTRHRTSPKEKDTRHPA